MQKTHPDTRRRGRGGSLPFGLNCGGGEVVSHEIWMEVIIVVVNFPWTLGPELGLRSPDVLHVGSTRAFR